MTFERITSILLCGALLAQGSVMQQNFGTMPDGTPVSLFTLDGGTIEVRITNYGGRIVSIRAPDRAGKSGDVAIGFDTLDGFLADNPYFGAIVGRYANRIALGAFALDGRTYKLPRNNGQNTLHGGPEGFDKRVWKAETRRDALVLRYLSRDGEEGFPGNLSVTVEYTVRGGDLTIDYSATADKPTVVNLTNHTYFNLAGAAERDILNHELTIAADAFTPVDKGLIPTGELRPVSNTPFDFRKPHRIGERIHADDEQLRLAAGYDHNFVLNGGPGALKSAARVVEPVSGRILEVVTTQPGMQFYTGNFLDGRIRGRNGVAYRRNYAFCLETQHYPDSPNHPKFPMTELRPGERFHSTTIYRFSTSR